MGFVGPTLVCVDCVSCEVRGGGGYVQLYMLQQTRKGVGLSSYSVMKSCSDRERHQDVCGGVDPEKQKTYNFSVGG